jgi:transposase-like protein
MSELTQVGAFCPNGECTDYGRVQSDQQTNIIRFGLTKAGRQRYHCNTCGLTFAQTKGTLFYRRRTTESEILEALAQIAEGSRISSVSRTTGHKEDTILAWLRAAARQVEAIEGVLMADYHLSRGQLDGEKTTIPRLPKPASSGVQP